MVARNKLDAVDIRILELMQDNARIKRNKLAEIIGLSIPTISERLHKLEEMGVIQEYRASLNHKQLGLRVTAFIFLMSGSSAHYDEVVERAAELEAVQECHAITGQGSHLLKVRVPDTDALESLLSEIQSWPGILNTTTDIVLSSAKETSHISLDHLGIELKKS